MGKPIPIRKHIRQMGLVESVENPIMVLGTISFMEWKQYASARKIIDACTSKRRNSSFKNPSPGLLLGLVKGMGI